MFRGLFKASFLFFSLCLLVLTSCDPMEKDVVGKWKVYNAEFVDGHMAQHDEEEVVNAIKGSYYDFREDGTVHFVDDYLNEKNGKWSLQRDIIDIEYNVVEEYRGFEYGSYEQNSHLKIMTTSIGKMSVKETFHSGQSLIYYLERVD